MRKGLGLRNIKTAIAVLICLFIYLALILIFKACNVVSTIGGNTLDGWAGAIRIATECYTPFFACIATAYSMSTDKGKSVEQARLRIVASLIGGLFGVLVVWLYTSITKNDWSFQFISATGNPTGGFTKDNFTNEYIASFIIPIILTGLSTVVVIWICNLLNQKSASFAAVLTLTAVMASLGTNAIIYGFNRIFSTIIGVLVALLVNLFHLPHKTQNKDLLFCVGIEGVVSNDSNELPGFPSFKLNLLNYRGANCTIFTTRIPTTFMGMLKNVKISHPVVCMSGAALYDTKTKRYLDFEPIPTQISNELDKFLESSNITPFKNIIEDDVLHIYCEKVDNIGEELYYQGKKNGPYCVASISKTPIDKEVLYYLLVIPEEDIKIVSDYVTKNFSNSLYIQIYDFFDNSDNSKGFKYLKIYNKEILKLRVLHDYANKNNLRIVGATTNELSNHLLDNSEIRLTTTSYNNSSTFVKKNGYEGLFKEMTKIYYSKKVSRK